MTTYNEALLKAIEGDLTNYHRRRMSKLQSEQAHALAQERANADPDERRIASLLADMAQTERNKRDVSITEREILDPLRHAISEEKE